MLFTQTLGFQELCLAFTGKELLSFALLLGFSLSLSGLGKGTAEVFLELFVFGLGCYLMLVKPFIVTLEERDSRLDFGDERA